MGNILYNGGNYRPFINDPRELAREAQKLYESRECPHCGNRLSLWEALAMVFGSGVEYYVKVKNLATGNTMLRPLPGGVNPAVMLIEDDRNEDNSKPPTKAAGERES